MVNFNEIRYKRALRVVEELALTNNEVSYVAAILAAHEEDFLRYIEEKNERRADRD